MSSEPQRTEEATHWILPDAQERPEHRKEDRGWRIHVELDDFDGYVELREEQVLPERVRRADANVICNERGCIRLRPDEAKWLRDRLDEVIPELERRYASGESNAAAVPPEGVPPR